MAGGSCTQTTDSLLSDYLILKSQRADVAVGTVPPDTVVVNLDILEYGPAHVLASGEALTMDHFHLEGMKEAFGHGVVVAITFAANAANQLMLG